MKIISQLTRLVVMVYLIRAAMLQNKFNTFVFLILVVTFMICYRRHDLNDGVRSMAEHCFE